MERIKSQIFIISLKRYIVSIISILFIVCLILFSRSNLNAAKDGLELWWNSVVPCLFPFFVANEILCSTGIVNIVGKRIEGPVKKIFNVPGEGAIALIMGIISGYPAGAKIVVDFRQKDICTKEEGERLLAFTNNSGPLFILGTVGVSLLENIKLGYVLLLSHILSSIIVGFIFRNWKRKNGRIYIKKVNKLSTQSSYINNFGEILSNSITKSISTVLNIGGFIVIFSVVISIIQSSCLLNFINLLCDKFNIQNSLVNAIIFGIIELTNGLKIIALLGSGNYIICFISFLMGFGGVSVLLQVYSIICKSDLSIKPYFYGKLLQSIISFFITFLLL